MSFHSAYQEMIKRHEQKRTGERLRRLNERHGHAERMFMEHVWWPAFRDFENLHPEYEVQDFRDGVRFLDFAYVRGPLRLAIEIDGFGPHYQKMSRTQFSDQWIRQNHLIIDGWKVLRFSYDDVNDRPRMCAQLLQQFMGIWVTRKIEKAGLLTIEEKEIIRMAVRLNHSFISPDGRGIERVRSYKLAQDVHIDSIQM
ncbi:DNA-binding response regulator [Paenibacillus sp. RC67]|uniref:DNA-binding response regulator n=1 Tax=Paenibacillus sp. RC67 TaxID=3039392 RepID=UPI0024AD4273|nr:DNA-binding response regulator [Paenibacillus sp. RC67]